MAMNFGQLQEAFDQYTAAGEQVDAVQLALWFNEALLDLAYDLGGVETLSLQVAAGEEMPLPEDCLRVVGCDLPCSRLPDGGLRFSAGGSGMLYYRATPSLFSGTESGESSGLAEPLQHLPALFAASRYWDLESEGEGEQSNQAAKWMSYYYQAKNLARLRLDSAAGDAERWQVEKG